MDQQVKNCLLCGSLLKGRLDKKFCNDYCRNTYNNSAQRTDTEYMRHVIYQLKRNRHILQSMLAEQHSIKTTRQLLLNKGFHFGFFTNSYTNQKGLTYQYCFELGYAVVHDLLIFIVRQQSLPQNTSSSLNAMDKTISK